MIQHLIGLILIGLGLQTPALPPSVLGDQDSQEVQTAEPSKSPEKMGEKIKALQQEFNTKRKEAVETRKTEVKDAMELRKSGAEGLKNAMMERREDFKDHVASRPAMLEERKKLQEQFKTQVEGIREKAKLEAQTQREAFKTRLQGIKDEKKKEVVQNADTKISDINTKRTQQATENLNKMDQVVARLTEKIAGLKAEGKDTSAAESALANAQAKLASAKSGVSGQAAKEYVIGVTSENKLKTDVGRSIQALQKDFQGVYDGMKAARESITDVVKQVALIASPTTETPEAGN